MFWDGMFHALTWLTTAVGIALLWRAGARRRESAWPAGPFVGSLFFGWGLFNLVEGILDHHLLHLHHVVERHGQSGYDLAFLASGLVFVLGGGWAMRRGRSRLEGGAAR